MNKQRRIITLADAYSGNNPNIKLHGSKYFFVKGREGKYNGVVMNKIISGVEFMGIYQNGTEIKNILKKVYYFDTDPENSEELRIYLVTGEMERFIYVREIGEFIDIKDLFKYRNVN